MWNLLVFTVEVLVTDRSRYTDDSFVTTSRIVEVLAATDDEARLVAAQIVAASHPEWMVLSSIIVECVA